MITFVQLNTNVCVLRDCYFHKWIIFREFHQENALRSKIYKNSPLVVTALIWKMFKKGAASVSEADGCIHISFYLEKANGAKTIHEVECGMGTLISGLKEDVVHMLGVPAENQMWYYKDELMLDTKSLVDYKVICQNKKKPIIIVKIAHA